MTNRRRYKVGVRKEYFPVEVRPELHSYIEIHEVLAHSRMDAAIRVWQTDGERLLGLMLPNRRKISLDVNDPTSRVKGNLGRLVPITVWTADDGPGEGLQNER